MSIEKMCANSNGKRALFLMGTLLLGLVLQSGAADVAGDYLGSKAGDLAIYHSGTGTWRIKAVAGGDTFEQSWGWDETHPVPGDYDGDGLADMAVYHRPTGNWYIRTVAGGVLLWGENWGFSTAHAAGAGDYDGDGKTDLAVFDAETGKWFIRTLDGRVLAWGMDWGWGQAQPIPGDYDGDGKTDLAIYDRLGGKWYIRTLDGTVLAWGLEWGFDEARPVPGDFDGDGKADLAVYHRNQGQWYIRTLDGRVLAWALDWGWSGARAVPGDYDGDGKSDMAVYHNETSQWYIRTLSGNALAWGASLGYSTAIPVPMYGNGGEGFIIVCFGDSITYGRGSSSNGPNTSYPKFLDNRLEAALGGYGYVVNAGIPGESTAQGRQRFVNVLNQYGPTLVLLMEGTNDLTVNDKGDQVIANLSWMANVARGRKISVVMSTLAPMVNRWFADRSAQHARVVDLNPRIRSLAASLNWPFAETYNRITSVSGWQNSLFNPDQSIHPNDDGYRLMRDEFIGAIRSGTNEGQLIY